MMEVVSPDPKDRHRDYDEKLADYAAAGISEYWIIDADQKLVSVYRLTSGQYVLHGQFQPGNQATSVLLPGFTIEVKALLARSKIAGVRLVYANGRFCSRFMAKLASFGEAIGCHRSVAAICYGQT